MFNFYIFQFQGSPPISRNQSERSLVLLGGFEKKSAAAAETSAAASDAASNSRRLVAKLSVSTSEGGRDEDFLPCLRNSRGNEVQALFNLLKEENSKNGEEQEVVIASKFLNVRKKIFFDELLSNTLNENIP